ncbi:hypothetical protein [Paenibacillus odorifer]|uniref:hypothetical protein n=1 Tax=Paenibacillus odorifer TaxID=189426 RepID=UPI00096F0140|nr:hypothetical protein [Paenibacillus odorifer]OMD67458.1 hypothetical protein BSK50_30240 [Paenibacillus odorifer]
MIFLNEIFDDYKQKNSDTEREKVVDDFLNHLRSSQIKFQKNIKTIKFKIDSNKLSSFPELIKLFEKYHTVTYKTCKSFYKRKDLNYIDFVKLKIENMYGYFIDKEVYLPREYYKLLRTPMNEYYRAIKLIDSGSGNDIDHLEIQSKINAAFERSEMVRNKRVEEKLTLSRHDFDLLIESYIHRIYNNYKPVEEYAKENGWIQMVDSVWSEDNYIIRYINKSLFGYFRTYIRDSKPKDIKINYCKRCRDEFVSTGSRHLYCSECSTFRKRESWKNSKRNAKLLK